MPWWRVLQPRVVQVRHGEGVGAWRQPGRAPRQSPPAVTVMACCFSDGAALARPPDAPQPVQLRHQRPGAVLQVLQVAVAVERPAVDAAGPAAPVAGLRGARTGSSGLGQQVQVWPLPNPEPGGIAISPGRRVFRPLTGVTVRGLVARLRPTHQAGGHGQVEAAS